MQRVLALLLLLLQGVVAPDRLPPVVLWYAPFLSGGGYSSEAISYLSALAEALDAARKTPDSTTEVSATVDVKPFALFATQHGDALNALFINTLPEEMRQMLIDVCSGSVLWLVVLAVDHSLVLMSSTSTGSKTAISTGDCGAETYRWPSATRSLAHGIQLGTRPRAVRLRAPSTRSAARCSRRIGCRTAGRPA